MTPRDLVWDGCVNVRDLGGLPTADGAETRFGSVIRADTLGLLSPDGWTALTDAGVTRIVDLREQVEIDADPPRNTEVELAHVPILEHFDDETWLEVNELSRAAPSHSEAQRLVYLHFLERCRPRFVEAIAAVADAPEGAVVIHCHGGKDRTGLLAALLLRLAGVSAPDVAADYALSGERLRERTQRWIASAETDEERARIERITSTSADAMHAVVDAIDEQYGGAERYLLDGGLSSDQLAAARARLR